MTAPKKETDSPSEKPVKTANNEPVAKPSTPAEELQPASEETSPTEVEPEAEVKTAVVDSKTGLHLRDEPDGDSIMVLPAKTIARVVDDAGDGWSRVYVEGYVRSEFLQLTQQEG